ncbi:ER-derived vesicles protein ERV14 [Trichophyton rubrum D6]|uniref:ER-derived vesicles protein ERV14 n=3 Tax=Trichophyton TaxID=5550 RepID=F2SQE1_TRIRC|nr:ER-derived vesicles protein ERV14 [Trichophyton rubrum CBS 118892]XP_047606415.1 ER-derived vesicles protein ERV14 [Trichophyton rubrum CBS 118892]EZF23923.1 ER-derived vesicles protein ERV14 [Trichophyton rubrum MR850]EZF43011.1 ER-derived vesicles protein ERV14 [Trichophyton rubrum CBS 100081]EZF53611.1 ER-derived vesicles protein ERV14 [Trichophyton rubrum CBS 288.86]EZF64279.1 ER-derived vesicles protein ERV14 [Trichophyton rubrum CBS 289.86]EZF74817.1 ER-derived vesicles protein ERV14
MSGEAWLYLLAVLINAVNLFLQVFFTIMYSDLECDYINPIDLCNRLNSYIIPEAAVHAFITFLFVINGYWLTIALNLPLLAYNAKKIFENQHLLDATEIFRKLNVHKKVHIKAQYIIPKSESTISDHVPFFFTTYRSPLSSSVSTSSCSFSTSTA